MIYPRLFIPNTLKVGQNIIFSKDKAHYIQRVLRLPKQSKITLFNGQGGEYLAEIFFQKNQVGAYVQQFKAQERELNLKITIAQGLATGNKMDWVIEKTVEMGAYSFIPIAAERSTVKLTQERAEKRVAHWQRIVEAASAQCGRNRLMKLSAPLTLKAYLQSCAAETQTLGHGLILCHHETKKDYINALTPPTVGWQHLHILIGPEGGWSEQEVALATSFGARPLLFGPRVLRTETAAIALIGAIRGFLNNTS